MIGLVAVTRAGRAAAARLAAAWPDARHYEGSAAAALPRAFAECDGIVCFLAAGATVRLIAPLLRGKQADPGVVCVDEALRYAVPVLGGHAGGANDLARRAALALGAEPVITTASDAAGAPALDEIAAALGFAVEPGSDLPGVGAAILDGERVTLTMDDQWPLPALPPNVVPAPAPEPGTAAIIVTDRAHDEHVSTKRTVVFRPPSLVVGAGSSRGVAAAEAGRLIDEALREAGVSPLSVRYLATADLKADEHGLQAAAYERGWGFMTFGAAALAEIAVPNPSEVVRAVTGTPSVAEAAALLGASASIADDLPAPGRAAPAGRPSRDASPARGAAPAGRPSPNAFPASAPAAGASPGSAPNGDAAPAGRPSPAASPAGSAAGDASPGSALNGRAAPAGGPSPAASPGGAPAGGASPGRPRGGAALVLPKRASAHATVAIARARPRGRLAVVGTGPGARDLMTPRAVAELRRASVVVGLDQYVEQVAGLLRPGTRVLASGLGSERERAAAAVAEARAGRAVALIGSGDAGIYAMASPALDMADGSFDVAGVPGVTAALAAAAVLGAPLGHDHAVISLSDLHTPWPVIERRIVAAAQADLVACFYNPASARRGWQLPRALELLAKCRPPSTPVGWVRDAARPGQAHGIASLESFDPSVADMRTMVIVGSSRTRIVAGRMVTPREYTWAAETPAGRAAP